MRKNRMIYTTLSASLYRLKDVLFT